MLATDRQLFETKKIYTYLKKYYLLEKILNGGYSIQYAGLLVSVWVMSNANDS